MSTHLLSLQSALENLPQTSRLMGLDLGTKTIGIATSDRSRQIASPITTIARTKFTKDATELLAIATKENVGVLVLGLGQGQHRVDLVRHFIFGSNSLIHLFLSTDHLRDALDSLEYGWYGCE